jgi:Zn-finger protein
MSCEYYPCHEMTDLDCRLCYCPFYSECEALFTENPNRAEAFWIGGYILDRSEYGLPPVWACELCTFNHRKDVTGYYEINKERPLKDVFLECLNSVISEGCI